MRACPCCRETLTSGVLGFGGRHLAGSCEVCGDAVCHACLGTRVLDAEAFRKRAAPSGRPGEKVKGRVCKSCLWEILTDRGETPPFATPPGQRERSARAAREACTHEGVTGCMAFCPRCGDEVAWKAEHGNPSCEACGAPSHRFFNACWACGESFDEENEPQAVARGYRLEFDCDSDECPGKLAWLMSFCPWCGVEKHWEHADAGGLECVECERGLDRAWAFCVWCGEEAPLPDDCPRCGLGLDKAASAARCEQCRHIVCGNCCEVCVVARGQGESRELLLCSTCGEGVEPVAEESAEAAGSAADEEEDSSEAPEDEEPEEEPADEEPREPEDRKEAPRRSPWEVLGVTPGTPMSETKRAYLALVAQYHPDKVAQLGPKLQALAQEETRHIIAAWEQLQKQARTGR